MSKFDELIADEPTIPESRNKPTTLKNGDIIPLNTILDKTSNTFDFKGVQKLRYFYHYDDKTLLIPVSVHKQIVVLRKEYGELMHSAKVMVTGQKMDTRYMIVPILK